MISTTTGDPGPPRLQLGAVCWAGLWILYELLAGSFDWPELVAGGLASLAATLAVLAAGSGEHLGRMRWGWWWLLVRRVPPEVISDTIRVLAAAVRRSPISGRFRTVAFEPGGDDAESASRRALVIFGASIAPDSYVVEIDRENAAILTHELVPKEPSTGRRDLRWPI
jgi:hypothetical protein